MSCFGCFSSSQGKTPRRISNNRKTLPCPPPDAQPPRPALENVKPNSFPAELATNVKDAEKESAKRNIAAEIFTFRQLATATKNFRQECLIGEGGFGRVYKGKFEKTGQVVAVKQLDRKGLQGQKEFLVEVLMLSLLHHQNLVNLIGYCADGDQRLLVYEYMPLGSLEGHLLDNMPTGKPLSWFTRMKIALGAAKGLEYLHDKANPPVIYSDLKSSNILLDKEFNAKLSDFGLAKLGPLGDKTHVSTKVMGTYGYCAPEYQRAGQLTVKSDVYSFGVVLLELISGRRAIDTKRPIDERNLVTWAEPFFKDPNKYPEVADPVLDIDFHANGLNQAVAVAAMCLQEEPSLRPSIRDVVTALGFLGTDPDAANAPNPSSPPSDHVTVGTGQNICSDDIAAERQRAVAEAMEWGSRSRQNSAHLSDGGAVGS